MSSVNLHHTFSESGLCKLLLFYLELSIVVSPKVMIILPHLFFQLLYCPLLDGVYVNNQ